MVDYKKRLDVFIASLCQDEIGELLYLEEKAEKNKVPIIKRGARNVLRSFLAMKRPEKILEIGTAIGFSTILMLKELERASVTTIENYPPRYEEAYEHFTHFGYLDRIRLIKGDAVELLSNLDEKFDFIFLDAAKAQYVTMLPDLIRVLKQGGLIFADNILQDNSIMESRYAVERRDRTIHSRMREYLYEITHHPNLKSSILPVDDGIAVSVKKRSILKPIKGV